MYLLRQGTLKRIHVDQKAIRRATAERTNEASLAIWVEEQEIKAHKIEILGLSELVQKINTPIREEVRVWIQTEAEVLISIRRREYMELYKVFGLSQEQEARLAEWIGMLEKTHGPCSSGGSITYSFTPTKDGNFIEILDQTSGEKLNLTEY